MYELNEYHILYSTLAFEVKQVQIEDTNLLTYFGVPPPPKRKCTIIIILSVIHSSDQLLLHARVVVKLLTRKEYYIYQYC